MDSISFIRIQKRLLEDLFQRRTLESQRLRHPAAARWHFCVQILKQGGVVRWPQQRDETPLLARTVLDAVTMIRLSGGDVQEMRLANLSEYGDDAVQAKLKSRINDPSQFEDLMVELSLAAWHQGKGHKVTPFEKEGWPDLRLDIEGFNRATFLECKRLAVSSPQRIAKHIQKANKQIKAVGIAAYGVVMLDITACIGSGLAPLTDDIPDGVAQVIDGVRAAVAGPKNRSVGRVLLMWDESGVLGDPPERTLIFLRRRLASVDHPSTNGAIEIPSGLPLFEGSTVVFTLHWDDSAAGITTLQVSDLMKQCSAWFNFTTDELIDAFNRRDKWQMIPVASDAEFVLFARRTVLNGKSAYTLCLGNRAADRLNLQFAIRVPPMIYDEIDLLTPLEMLQLTVEKYGLPVTVGGLTALLVLRHTFEVQVASDPGCLTQVHNPDNHDFLHSFLVKISPKQPGFVIDCAFVFALDRTRLEMDLA